MIKEGLLPWPDEVRAAVARFRQGDLIERPPFFYCDTARYPTWRATQELGDPSAPMEPFLLSDEDAPPYGMITTQTCDLVEEVPSPKQPWLQVAPVYSLANADPGYQRQVRRHEVGYLLPLDPPALPAGLWVADLRIELALGKGLLVGREPFAGFAVDADTRRMAERLARRRERPALAGSVSDTIVSSLRARLKGDAKAHAATFDAIDQLRLTVAEGTALQPSVIEVTVIAPGDTPDHVTSWFAGWWEDAVLKAKEVGVTLLHPRHCTLRDLNGEEYSRSYRLDFDFLSPDE